MNRFLPVVTPVTIAAALLFNAGGAAAQSFSGSVLRDAGTAAQTLLSAQGPQSAVADWITSAHGAGTAYDGSVSGALLVTQVQASSDGSEGRSFTSRLSFTQTVTNPYADARAVGFDFVVPGSRLQITTRRGEYRNHSLDAGAAFSGRIEWGADSVWTVDYGITAQAEADSRRLVTAVSPASRSPSAADYGWTVHDDLAVIDAPVGYFDPVTGVWHTTGSERVIDGSLELSTGLYSKHLSLGVLGGGETRTLRYTLEAVAWYADRSSAPAGFGGAGWAAAGGSDPFGVQFEPATALSFTTPVPEPGTVLTMAAGLLAVAARVAARRRQSPR